MNSSKSKATKFIVKGIFYLYSSIMKSDEDTFMSNSNAMLCVLLSPGITDDSI